MTAFCPSCGFNLERDTVLEVDGFTLDPRGIAGFAGRQLMIRAREVTILHTVAEAQGRTISRDVIASRIGYDGEGNAIDVYMSRLRQALLAAGAPNPIRNVWGRGFAWVSPALAKEKDRLSCSSR